MNDIEYDILYQAEDSYWWYVGLHQLIEHYIGKIRGTNRKTLDMFDAGCGTGKLLSLLARFGSAHGIDASEKAIRYCGQRGLRNVEIADLNTFVFPESSYDVVTSIDVLYHEAVENDIEVAGKIFKSLKPNGALLLNLPAFDCLNRNHDRAVGGKRRYRRNKLADQLRRLGFTVEKATYRLSHMFVPILIKKYLEKIVRDDAPGSDIDPLPRSINWLMLQINMIENWLIKKANMPFGTSLFVIARKP